MHSVWKYVMQTYNKKSNYALFNKIFCVSLHFGNKRLIKSIVKKAKTGN